MREEDLTVKQYLSNAGFGDRPASSRGDLYSTLTLLMQIDCIKFGDFVEKLRSLLTSAEAIETEYEQAKLRSVCKYIKACPDCGGQPRYFSGLLPGTGEGQVACLHENDVTVRTGETLADAIANWNSDDWVRSVDRKEYVIGSDY